MPAAATRPGHSHRRPPPLPLGRSCTIAPTPRDLPISSPNAQAPSHALRPGYIPSRFLPPAPLRCVGCSTSFPTLPALCAHLNSPGTTCTFAPDSCPIVDADRHLLPPCTFCGRYFHSGGLNRHQHSCSHINTTPSQPPACGASFPRGRPSPVQPQSLPPAVQLCLDHGATGGENSKASSESYLLSFRSSTSSNGVPPSVIRQVRLFKPFLEELVGCVLSLRGRATQGASAEAAWAALLLFPRLVLRPMAYFTSIWHLPPDPVADYRDNRLAH
jgi:hypothetical protein